MISSSPPHDFPHPVVSIFGSSLPRHGDEEYKLAHETGKLLAEAGFTICNGGYAGTMEASAKGAKTGGGKTIGIVSSFFSVTANPYIDRIIITEVLTDRLLKLIELGDAFVVLKGSTGTLLELAAVWEFINKGVIKPRPVILIGNFWNPVVDTLRNELVHEGKKHVSTLVQVASSPKEGVKILLKHFNL
jgi:uncharacterized protein (TIGR00730 family)